VDAGPVHLVPFLNCVADLTTEMITFVKVEKMLEDAIKTKNLLELVEALKAVLKALSLLNSGFPHCDELQRTENWAEFNEIMAISKDPVGQMAVVGSNIWFNEVDITHNLALATDAYAANDFQHFGKDLGTALKDALVKNPRKELFLF